MARGIKDENDVQIGTEEKIADTTERETSEAVQERAEERPAKPAVKVGSDAKKVRIHTVEEVDCIVASVPYNIRKDKDATVPADVAAILVFGKKAYRI